MSAFLPTAAPNPRTTVGRRPLVAFTALALLTGLLPLAAAAPASAAPVTVQGIEAQADTATSVRVCWNADSDAALSWVLRVAAGQRTPTATDRTVLLPASASCPVVDGLATDQPYTFAVSAVTAEGEGPATTALGAARVQGAYVASRGALRTVTNNTHPSTPALAVSPNGTEHALVMLPVRLGPHRSRLRPAYATRRPGAAWSTPQQLATNDSWDRAQLSVNRRGDVLAAWDTFGTGPTWRVKRAGAGWGPVQHLARQQDTNYRLDGAVIDNRGRTHLLYDVSSRRGHAMTYRTNATGRWTTTVALRGSCGIDGSLHACAPSLLTYDPVTDRVAVVGQTSTRVSGRGDHAVKRVTIRAATASARSAGFPTLRAVRSQRTDAGRLLPTSVVLRRGRVVIAVRQLPSADLPATPTARHGLYLLTSGPRWRFQRVPGSTYADVAGSAWEDFRVASLAVVGRDVLTLATQRFAEWDPALTGVWRRTLRHTASGAWRQKGALVRVSSSHYDRVTGLATDRRGRPYVGISRDDYYGG